MNLNRFYGVGRLTSDPEYRSTPQGTTMARFNIAINDKYKSNGQVVEETFFIGGTIWGASADTFLQFFHKGDQVYVEGKLRDDKWEKEGVTYHRTVLKDVRWEFADGKRNPDTTPAANGATIPGADTWNNPAPEPATQAATAAPKANPVAQAVSQPSNIDMPSDYDPFADEDIPGSYNAPF